MHGEWIEEGQEWGWMTKEWRWMTKEWGWMTKELALLEVSGRLGTMVEMERKNERQKRGKIIGDRGSEKENIFMALN